MFEEEGHVSGSESGEEGRDGGRIGTSPIPSVDRASSPVTEPAAPETSTMSIWTMLERVMSAITAQGAKMTAHRAETTAQGAEMANQFVTQRAEMTDQLGVMGEQLGARIDLMRDELGEKMEKMKTEMQECVDVKLGEIQSKFEDRLEETRVEITLEGENKRKTLVDKIDATNIRVDKVDEGLERHRACVDARMQLQVEEWGELRKQGMNLAEEVKGLEARLDEQDKIMSQEGDFDKDLVRVSGLVEEQLQTRDGALEEVVRAQRILREEVNRSIQRLEQEAKLTHETLTTKHFWPTGAPKLDTQPQGCLIPGLDSDKGETGKRATGKVIPLVNFDGSGSLEAFLTQFECISRLNGWNERERTGNLVATLRGPAADVLNVIAEGMLTSSHICEALSRRFGFAANCDLVRAQLQHRRLKSGETVQELAQDIYQSVRIAYRDLTVEAWDRLALEKFLAALPDPEVRALVELQDPPTVHRAAECAARLASWSRPGRVPERPSVTIRQAEIRDQGGGLGEIGIIQMFQEICQKLSSLIRGNSAVGAPQRRDPAPPIEQFDYGRGGPEPEETLHRYARGPFMGSCFRCGRRGHVQRYCRYPAMERPSNGLLSPERMIPPAEPPGLSEVPLHRSSPEITVGGRGD